VQLGIWISPVNNAAAEADNQAEIAKGVALATQFRSLVDVVSVGNETMVEWSTHKVAVADMARYLAQVRQAVPQPITTNDNFLFWKGVPNAIAEIVDFAAVHTYPFLDTFYNPTVIDWRQKSVPARPARRCHGGCRSGPGQEPGCRGAQRAGQPQPDGSADWSSARPAGRPWTPRAARHWPSAPTR
jgi:hypothetical protein